MCIALAMLLTWACTFKLALTEAMPLFIAFTMTLPMAFAMSLKKYRCHDHFIGYWVDDQLLCHLPCHMYFALPLSKPLAM